MIFNAIPDGVSPPSCANWTYKWLFWATKSIWNLTFSITLSGKVRQNGLIGEEIYVILESTGKRLKGIIDSPKHIIVNK